MCGKRLLNRAKKARPGTRIVFGDGRLKAEVIDVVEEGNRLVHFEYDGIFEEVLDALGEMPLPPYITLSLKIKTVIRLFMQNMKARRQRRQQVFILQKSFLKILQPRVSK